MERSKDGQLPLIHTHRYRREGDMEFMVDLGSFANHANQVQLRDKVRRLEDSGMDGVSAVDHLFVSVGQDRTHAPFWPCDPVATLAAVGGMSDTLKLQNMVGNTTWMHPALWIRHFAQMAVFFGGERVHIGFGASWNREEWDAMRLVQPSYRERVARLDETLQLTRQLFHDRVATLDGTYVSADRLPMPQIPDVPPKIWVGGGSDNVLTLAAKYADGLNFHGDPRHGKISTLGETSKLSHSVDVRRRALTTVDNLAERVAMVNDIRRAAGITSPIEIGVHAWYVVFGNQAEVRRAEEWICERWAGIPYQSLRECPFLLLGEPQQIADTLMDRQERMGLTQVVLRDADLEREDVDFERFGNEVLPLLRAKKNAWHVPDDTRGVTRPWETAPEVVATA